MNTKTWTPRAAEIERRWFVIDAEGQTLGRLATKVASTLMGKGKPTFADHLDSGDFVIVINSAKLVVTGDRLLSKKYHSHSGQPGGYRCRCGSSARSTEAGAPRVSPKEKSVASLPYYQGTGRRKTSIARVRLVAGEGQIVINGRTYEQHFGGAVPQSEVFAPYRVTGTEGRFNAMVKVEGGGISGQAGAIRHGISRALLSADPEAYRLPLRQAGFLTRDPRAKERKKYGLRRARKAKQFTKR
ncbi:30S ribosomal protein S9 [bacterium]|nr:30S ribosomal protein S9 [bacterium]